MRVPRRLRECLFADDREAHAGHALEALVARGDERVEGDFAGVERDRPERAHRVDDQAAPVPRGHGGDLGERVEHARGGFAVDHRDVRDPAVGGERRIERRGVVGHVLGSLDRGAGAAHDLADAGDALAVGAVHQHQHLAVAGKQRADRRLDGEGAASLDRHANMSAFTPGEGDEPLAHAGVEGDEFGVARAPVAHHRSLGLVRRGQRSGGEQERFVAGRHGGIVLDLEEISGCLYWSGTTINQIIISYELDMQVL